MDNSMLVYNCIKVNMKIISIEELLYLKKGYIIHWDIELNINVMEINYVKIFILKFNLKI